MNRTTDLKLIAEAYLGNTSPSQPNARPNTQRSLKISGDDIQIIYHAAQEEESTKPQLAVQLRVLASKLKNLLSIGGEKSSSGVPQEDAEEVPSKQPRIIYDVQIEICTRDSEDEIVKNLKEALVYTYPYHKGPYVTKNRVVD